MTKGYIITNWTEDQGLGVYLSYPEDLVVGFTLYEVRFKYPPTVRKSRKIRKKIRKSKKTKPVKDIMSREELIKDHLESNAEIIQLEKKTENGFKKNKN